MIYFLLVQIYGISINKEKYIHNKMTNIKDQLLMFNTVDEIVETKRGCKSLNGTLYIIRLWSEVGIYDFKNEMYDIDDLKNYIILTEIPGFETEYEYIGIVDGVRDLTDWAFRNLSFPKGTKMRTIANCCEKIVEDIKELYASIKYSEWIDYTLTPEEILQRVSSLTESFKSDSLSTFAREHGGLINGDWSVNFGNDLYNMSDTEFEDYEIVDKNWFYDEYGNSDYINKMFKPIEFRDGTFMVVKNPSVRQSQREINLRNKWNDRYAKHDNDVLDKIQNKLLSYGYTEDGGYKLKATYSMTGPTETTISVGLGTIDDETIIVKTISANDDVLMQTSFSVFDDQKMNDTIFSKRWIAFWLYNLPHILEVMGYDGYDINRGGPKNLIYSKKTRDGRTIVVNLDELWRGRIGVIILDDSNKVISNDVFSNWDDAEKVAITGTNA